MQSAFGYKCIQMPARETRRVLVNEVHGIFDNRLFEIFEIASNVDAWIFRHGVLGHALQGFPLWPHVEHFVVVAPESVFHTPDIPHLHIRLQGSEFPLHLVSRSTGFVREPLDPFATVPLYRVPSVNGLQQWSQPLHRITDLLPAQRRIDLPAEARTQGRTCLRRYRPILLKQDVGILRVGVNFPVARKSAGAELADG